MNKPLKVVFENNVDVNTDGDNVTITRKLRIKDYCEYYDNHLDEFIEKYFNIKLNWYQKLVIRLQVVFIRIKKKVNL